jgi:uncharacterized protein YndB with AHSA1/START domain
MVQQTKPTPVRVHVTVAAPVERAFAVFTEQCDRWWPPTYRLGPTQASPILIEPYVGGRWYEDPAEGEQADWGKVLEWDPPRRLVLSWQITPEFTSAPDEQRASRVEVDFTPAGSAQTDVTLLHTELERHGEQWEIMRGAVADAWPGIMATFADVAAAWPELYWVVPRGGISGGGHS